MRGGQTGVPGTSGHIGGFPTEMQLRNLASLGTTHSCVARIVGTLVKYPAVGGGVLQEELDPTKESGVRKGPILAGAWGRSRAPRDIRAGAQVVATVASPPFPQPSAVFRLHSGAVQRQPCLYSSPTS